MPSASTLFSPPPTITTSTSTTTLKANTRMGSITIKSASIVSFERRSDQKMWYTIKVDLQSHNNKPRAYFITRRYEDFIQFSQRLHDRFNTPKQRAGSRLPPKLKTRFNILPASKQLHAQRAEELAQFLNALFQKPSMMITESLIVLEFFGVQSLSHDEPPENAPSSRWKRLRCTSFLARSSSSTTGLSSLCSQAANKIMPSWNRPHYFGTPQPSMSTPVHTNNNSNNATTVRLMQSSNTKVGELKKSKSSLCISSQHPLSESTNSSRSGSIASSSHLSTSTSATTIIPSPSVSQQLKSTIKIKVMYNVDNIVVLQVPRSIALSELRSRIIQKFSDLNTDIKEDVVLLYNDSISSCCSIGSFKNTGDVTLPALLISKEQELAQIMHTKWNRLEKVTLRCIM